MNRSQIINVGVNDRQIDLFEGQYLVPEGMAYNSYVILDEKIAVIDTVDARFVEEWLGNLKRVLAGRIPDYLIVQHMEPDHSSGISAFFHHFPEAVAVASEKAFPMMKNFLGDKAPLQGMTVGEGTELSLGAHTLRFLTAPMVHWPEVILSYDVTAEVLFSADAFGKFGDLNSDEEWDCEARRYYFGIVGKYGSQVQALLKKVSTLTVRAIYPLHGPVLEEPLSHYLSLYDTWSSYRPEARGVTIAYASMYGNTKKAALILAEELKKLGEERVSLFDLARDDMAEAVEDAFRYDRLVLAAPTYNAGVFPAMREFLFRLSERNYQNRTVALMENGSWAPMASKRMRESLAGGKDLRFTSHTVTVLSAVSEETRENIRLLAEELFQS